MRRIHPHNPTRPMLLLALLCLTGTAACGGLSDKELGLVASWAMHSVEQTRLAVEGLDPASFGSSALVTLTEGEGEAEGQGFGIQGAVDDGCGGSAAASGGGTLTGESYSYNLQLQLDGWHSCDGEVMLSGPIMGSVTSQATAVTSFRKRPSTALVTGRVTVSGSGIASDHQDTEVGFELTLSTSPDEPEPKVCGNIDAVDLCD